jgi:CopG family nickel-responsive transcriptional regulator
MHRITISLDDELTAELDAYMHRKGYENRSEAFRDLLRARLEADRGNEAGGRNCVACLTYIYDHEERALGQRLVRAQHRHHDLSLSTLHVHLDHDNCLEVAVLRGNTDKVRTFSNEIVAQRGVRHGHLHLVPADIEIAGHSHGRDSVRRGLHVHSRPRT